MAARAAYDPRYLLVGNLLQIIRDRQEWADRTSPYLSYDWCKAAATLEQGSQWELAVTQHAEMAYLIRPIPGTSYFDIISPFDFGGVFGDAEEAIRLWQKLYWYMEDRRVVSMFLRCHPKSWASEVFTQHVRDNVVVDLNNTDVQMWEGISKTAQDTVKQGQRAGLDYKPCPISDFMGLYLSNMRELKRDQWYHFPAEWFESIEPMVQCWGAYQDGALRGAHLYVPDGDILFYFLSASDLEYRNACRPNDWMFWQTMLRAKAEGFKLFYLGGGETESLRWFKQKWSRDRVPYYVAKAIFMPDVYRKLSQGRETNYFPAYRG